MKQTIFICGYPKSGTTWLTRLLGDILGSSTGGSHFSQDGIEVASEERGGPYFIRKGHYRLLDTKEGGANPGPHQIAWRLLIDEKVAFLVRDPRDICISGSFHWDTTPEQFLERMIKGDIARVGRWDNYLREWFSLSLSPSSFASMRYEDLIEDTLQQTKRSLNTIKVSTRGMRIRNSVKRQSFEAISQRIPLEEHRVNNLREARVGSYKDHFTPKMLDRIWSEFGWMMQRMGYEY